MYQQQYEDIRSLGLLHLFELVNHQKIHRPSNVNTLIKMNHYSQTYFFYKAKLYNKYKNLRQW